MNNIFLNVLVAEEHEVVAAVEREAHHVQEHKVEVEASHAAAPLVEEDLWVEGDRPDAEVEPPAAANQRRALGSRDRAPPITAHPTSWMTALVTRDFTTLTVTAAPAVLMTSGAPRSEMTAWPIRGECCGLDQSQVTWPGAAACTRTVTLATTSTGAGTWPRGQLASS